MKDIEFSRMRISVFNDDEVQYRAIYIVQRGLFFLIMCIGRNS